MSITYFCVDFSYTMQDKSLRVYYLHIIIIHSCFGKYLMSKPFRFSKYQLASDPLVFPGVVTRSSCHRATAFCVPPVTAPYALPRVRAYCFLHRRRYRPVYTMTTAALLFCFGLFLVSKNVYCSERETRDVPPGKPFEFPKSSGPRLGDRLESRVSVLDSTRCLRFSD